MHQQQWVALLLTSSVIAAFISATTSYVIQKIQHINKYHETLIHKRCEALNLVETFIQSLKITVLDDEDKKPYHLSVIAPNTDLLQAQILCVSCIRESMWLSRLTLDLLSEINKYLYLIPEEREKRIMHAKDRYIEISTHRAALERELMREYSDAANVDAFLKRKSNENSSFQPFVPR